MRKYLRTIDLYSTSATYLAGKEIEIGEKTQNKGYYAFQGHPRSSKDKVIEVCTNRKPVCDFLLVIISNWQLSRTVSEISQPIVQILDTAFLSHPLGGLGTTYDIHLWPIGKRVVDFLLVLR